MTSPFAGRTAAPLAAAAMSLALVCAATPATALELGLPVACVLGEDCFLQQFPDMDPGPEAVDPFCGAATYQGHDGTDLRVRSMADVARGVDVVAMADGKVMRLRDGEPDRLVRSEADQAAVADRECGNGMIVAHGDGYETQFCHLRRGSIVVKPGDTVLKGAKLGQVGASGLAAFPHVHVTVRKDGKPVDPATGRDLSAGCSASGSGASLFEPQVARQVVQGDTSSLLGFGLAGEPVDHDALSVVGPPPEPNGGSPAFVAWAWFINLRQGDRIRLSIAGPDGGTIVDQTSEPLDRTKASYSFFAGKRGAPPAGAYRVGAMLLRGSETVIRRDDIVDVRR